MQYLEFEKGVAELEGTAEELRAVHRNNPAVDISTEVEQIKDKTRSLLAQLYDDLTPWQKCLVARHPDRPHCQDYVQALFDEFTPLAGDRAFAEDHAIIGGMARFRDRPVMVIGQEKGHDTQSRIHRNFGMPRPEGYRKAIRLMEMADRFGLPVIAFVDTPGAYPGKGAEERGQAEAIARSTDMCLQLSTPVVAAVIGEGGSGGAVALATANRLLMLEHTIYSVISPEGCASILWKSADRAKDAAAALKLTAQDLLALGVADHVVDEPLGGAQRDPKSAIAQLGEALAETLSEFDAMTGEQIRADRREKFMTMGRRKLS